MIYESFDVMYNILLYIHIIIVGCHINGEYAGAFGYADDIVLLSPSLYALKHYITVCEDYAKRFNILFNPINPN